MSNEGLPELTKLVSSGNSFGVTNTQRYNKEEVVLVIIPRGQNMKFSWDFTPVESIELERKLAIANNRFRCPRCIGTGKRLCIPDPEIADMQCPYCDGTGIKEKYR